MKLDQPVIRSFFRDHFSKNSVNDLVADAASKGSCFANLVNGNQRNAYAFCPLSGGNTFVGLHNCVADSLTVLRYATTLNCYGTCRVLDFRRGPSEPTRDARDVPAIVSKIEVSCPAQTPVICIPVASKSNLAQDHVCDCMIGCPGNIFH